MQDHSILVHHVFHFLGVRLLLQLQFGRSVVLQAFLLEDLSNWKVFTVLASWHFAWLSAIWLIRIILSYTFVLRCVVSNLAHLLAWNLVCCDQSLTFFRKTICAAWIRNNLGAFYRVLRSPKIRVIQTRCWRFIGFGLLRILILQYLLRNIMLIIKLCLNIVVLLLRIDPNMIILGQHRSILEILLLHTKG